MERPGVLRWFGYAVGKRLPRRYNDWVLHDAPSKHWRARYVLQRSIRHVPLCAVRLPRVAPGRIEQLLREDRIRGADGPLGVDTPYEPGSFIWFHRDLPDEVPVPFAVRVVHRDEHLLVVDKPHFLATIPRGQHILETALVRLRREHDLPQLSPAHRLDRVTAGLVMFVITPSLRGAYQTLFRDRKVHKEYEAIARYDPTLRLPLTVRSRIMKKRGVLAAQEVPGPPNAETHVELLEHRDGLGRYRLLPSTGR